MKIDGTTILITGASQGIGKQMAIHFAPKAAEVIIAARNQDKLNETADLIRAVGGKTTPLVLDLSDPQSIQQFSKELRASGKHIDILINNAANTVSKPLLKSSLEEIDATIRTNVIGCAQLCYLVAPMMVERGHGMIINISSLAGYNPNGRQTIYSTSKAAVNSFSEALRDELALQGIYIMNVAQECIATGTAITSQQIPFEQFVQRFEAAILRNETEFFLSPGKKFVMRLYKFLPVLSRLKAKLKKR